MIYFVIFFSIFVAWIIGWVVWWKIRKPYRTFFLETGEVKESSYRETIKTNQRYFYHSKGRVDLDKHPDLLRFREINGNKEYLVKPWDMKENLYLDEGVTKLVVFEIFEMSGVKYALLCLRKLESLVENEVKDPLKGNKEDYLLVSYLDNKKIIHSENLFGIVVYESN